MRAVPGRPTLTGRLVSALALDRNPLRRASDRAEAWIRAGLLVVFLVAGPMAAVAAGQWIAHTAGVQASTQSAPPHPASAQTSRAVQLRPRMGFAAPPAAAQAEGARAAGGQRPGRFAGDAWLAAVLALVAVALVLLTVMRLARRVLNRRRLAAWEQAWQTIGPRWTGRRS
jgi:hypothetical protein